MLRIAGSVVGVLAAVASAGGPDVLRQDAVELIAGHEVAGREELAVDRDTFTYWFATEANRDTFLSDPAAYEIQLGGACARMGPLSGRGTPDIHAVHAGRLYIFASEQCRAGFLKSPEKLLLVDDPRPDPSGKELLLGRLRAQKAVIALGGERVDSISALRLSTSWTAGTEDTPVQRSRTVTFAFPDRVRVEETWDDYRWGDVCAGGRCETFDGNNPPEPASSIHALEVWREARIHPLTLLRLREEPDAVVYALREDAEGSFRLWLDGREYEIVAEAETGLINSILYRGHGPGSIVGLIERRFGEYAPIGGLTLPARVTTVFESDIAPEGDLAITSDASLAIDESAFELTAP